MTGKYEIRIGKCLQTAWENFLKAPEVFLLLALAQMASLFILGRFPFLGPLFTFVIGSLSLPAFFLLAEHAQKGQPVKFPLLLELVPVAPQVIVVALLKWVFVVLGFMLLVLPGIYAAVVYCFAEIFATIEKKSFWESMETSRELVHRNFVGVLGLCFVCFLIFVTGVLLLGVGVLATLPISALLLHAAYHDIRTQVSGVLPAPT